MYLCLSVCLSHTNIVSKWLEWILLIFGTEASRGLSYTVFSGYAGILKNKGTCLWDFCSNSGLRKIHLLSPMT